MSISLNRLAIVGVLSSAANIPLLGATIACAIEFNSVELISISPNFRTNYNESVELISITIFTGIKTNVQITFILD